MGVLLKMVSTPKNPMVLLIIIPMKNGYFIGNIPNIFRQTHRTRCPALCSQFAMENCTLTDTNKYIIHEECKAKPKIHGEYWDLCLCISWGLAWSLWQVAPCKRCRLRLSATSGTWIHDSLLELEGRIWKHLETMGSTWLLIYHPKYWTQQMFSLNFPWHTWRQENYIFIQLLTLVAESLIHPLSRFIVPCCGVRLVVALSKRRDMTSAHTPCPKPLAKAIVVHGGYEIRLFSPGLKG